MGCGPALRTGSPRSEPPACSRQREHDTRITATTLINGTIDELLAAAANCREVVLLGPSTPLVPEVFAKSPRRVILLAGVVVTNAEELLRTVARDGETRDFKTSVVKVNVRVSAVGQDPSSA